MLSEHRVTTNRAAIRGDDKPVENGGIWWRRNESEPRSQLMGCIIHIMPATVWCKSLGTPATRPSFSQSAPGVDRSKIPPRFGPGLNAGGSLSAPRSAPLKPSTPANSSITRARAARPADRKPNQSLSSTKPRGKALFVLQCRRGGSQLLPFDFLKANPKPTPANPTATAPSH